MLKKNLLAIAIIISGLIFTSEAFGQLSATTTGIKSPRDVSSGQKNTKTKNKSVSKSQDKLGNFEIQDVKKPTTRQVQQGQNSGGTISNQRTSSNQTVRRPSNSGLIDTSTGEIVWIRNNQTSTNRARNLSATDEELGALIDW